MTTDKKKLKKYSEHEEKFSMLEEPAIVYGSTPNRYSYADYLTWLDDKTREIIDGIVRLMPFSVTRTHAKLSLKISHKLMTHIEKRGGKCEVYHAPFDVCLPKNGETADDKIYTVVQPDVCVVCDLSKLDERCCLGAPDLIVEVQSPSTARYDLTRKFRTYEEAGVREYWVVFPKKASITVFYLQEDGKYDEGTIFNINDKVTSQVLEGLEIDMKRLFSF